jgi:hypothetical protein
MAWAAIDGAVAASDTTIKAAAIDFPVFMAFVSSFCGSFRGGSIGYGI